MSEQKAAYDAKVSQIAEEMAREDVDSHCSASDSPDDFPTDLPRSEWFNSLSEQQKEVWIRANMHAARVAVKHMAKAFKWGVFADDDPDGYDDIITSAYQAELQQRGLVPVKPNENE